MQSLPWLGWCRFDLRACPDRLLAGHRHFSRHRTQWKIGGIIGHAGFSPEIPMSNPISTTSMPISRPGPMVCWAEAGRRDSNDEDASNKVFRPVRFPTGPNLAILRRVGFE